MLAFKSIYIIYNPASTGKSEANAHALHKKLQKALPHVPVRVIATQHAGHAEELACTLAKKHSRPLIVSSSGDGGYHEVINGVMRAGKNAMNPICAVLASGNANDHSRTMQTRPLWEAIVEGAVTRIDVLRFTIHSKDKKTVRYAHSYAGLGITPIVAKEVNDNSYNRWQELRAVFKIFYSYKPFQVKHAGKWLLLDSLLFSNINQMAKVFKLSKQNKPDDGKVRVIAFSHTKKRYFAVKIAKAIIGKTDKVLVTSTYEFSTKKPMPMQIDGEVLELSAHSTITVEVVKQGLATIL